MYYLVMLVLLFLAELFYFRIADKCNIIDKPNERSSHTRITLRGGGIIFYFGALGYFLSNDWSYPWFMLALTLITFISFVDDICSTSQGLRLVFHFTAMALMFYQWGLFSLSWWWIIIALIVCTGIINAYNFMDGINGITGCYSLVILGSLAYINTEITQFVEPALIYTVLCSVLVFCFFNFRKKAKCFAGDVGSVSIASFTPSIPSAGFNMNTLLMFSLPNPLGATVMSTLSPGTMLKCITAGVLSFVFSLIIGSLTTDFLR